MCGIMKIYCSNCYACSCIVEGSNLAKIVPRVATAPNFLLSIYHRVPLVNVTKVVNVKCHFMQATCNRATVYYAVAVNLVYPGFP